MTDAEKELKRQRAQKLSRLKKNSIKGKILKSKKPKKWPLLRFCGGKSKSYSRKK